MLEQRQEDRERRRRGSRELSLDAVSPPSYSHRMVGGCLGGGHGRDQTLGHPVLTIKDCFFICLFSRLLARNLFTTLSQSLLALAAVPTLINAGAPSSTVAPPSTCRHRLPPVAGRRRRRRIERRELRGSRRRRRHQPVPIVIGC